MRIRDHRADDEPDINLVPLIDVILILIIFFNAAGRYFIGEQAVLRDDIESLKTTLAEVAGDDRDRPVLLRADARTPHQAVVTAYDALGQLGFRRVMVATAPAPSATPGSAP